MYASGLLEGWKTLPNHVGKQKIGKADVVLSSSCLNLINCSLTSSIYLMNSVTTVYFKEIYATQVIFFNIIFIFYIIEILGLATQKNTSVLKK